MSESPMSEGLLRSALPHTVGQSLAHESAALHVAGRAAYIDDLPEPQGCLHAAIGLSPLAHGRLEGIDTATLMAQPGVVAVYTAADIPGHNEIGPIVHDDPILAEGELRYLGQPVFLVVAHSREQARRAARLSSQVVRAQSLPAQLDVRAAHAAQDWVVPPMHLTRALHPGGVAAALAQAPQRLSGRFSLGGQEQFYLEGQIALALPQDGGALRVHSSTQHPSEMQAQVAEALGLHLAGVLGG